VTELAEAGWGEPGSQHPAVQGIGVALYEPALFERQDHISHRLRTDERSSGDLCDGQTGLALQDRESRQFGHRELVRRQAALQFSPNAVVDPADEVDKGREHHDEEGSAGLTTTEDDRCRPSS
jgi:hypothetical protein